MTIDLTHQLTEQGLLVCLSGRLAAKAVPGLAEELDGLIQTAPRRLVVDLAGLEYISTAGMGLLFSAFQAMSLKDAYLALAGAKGQVAMSLELGGLEAVFTLAETLEEAWSQI